MVRIPTFTLTWAAKDVTENIKPYVQSIVYDDKIEGQESDTIEITLDNPRLIWANEWLPDIGDKLALTLGYVGEPKLGVVEFQIDKIVNRPLTCSVSGLATPTDQTLREKKTQAYENTSLKQIAEAIASRNKLTLVGKVKDVQIQRVTQNEQTDLEFLRQISKDYGLIFKVENTTKLVFYEEKDLQESAATLTIKFEELSSFEIEESQQDTFTGGKLAYQDPTTGDLIKAEKSAKPKAPTKADNQNQVKQVENEQQASLQAEEALRQANQGQIKGRLELEGITQLSAGSNFNLEGVGKYSGKYQARSLVHNLNRQAGYRVTIDVIRLEPVDRG